MNSDLVKRLQTDFSQFNFKLDPLFYWSSSQNTIFYNCEANDWQFLLLHELGHALLGHTYHQTDQQLLTMELDAWEQAKQLAPTYDVKINSTLIDDTVNSYRIWLHERSLCPYCHNTGFQIKDFEYQCPNCDHKWRVNSAKQVRLKRMK